MTESGGSIPLTPSGPDEQLDEFRTLVRSAFEQAQRSKQDWEEMTSAVLKNRLLSITKGQFSQDRYGSPSFIHLVRRVPDLLEVLDDSPPFHLRIRSPAETGTPSLPKEEIPTEAGNPFASTLKGDLRQVRIRDDLWHAIMDYSSHATYVLDPDTGLARANRSTDYGLPNLPTVSREDVASWRSEFIQTLEALTTTRFSEELGEWARTARQSDLPSSIRGLWAEFNKRKVIDKLLEWFKEREQAPPKDMIFATDGRDVPSSRTINEVVETRRLRDLVIRAVKAMTHDELSQVPLPASVILRITGRRSGEDE